MRRKLLLPALAACTLLAISAPVSTAQSNLGKKLSQVSGAVKGLQKSVTFLRQGETGVKAAIGSVDARVDTVVKTVAAITAGVPAIVDGLSQLKAGLTKLGDAYSAVEYGVTAVTATNAAVAAGGSVTSSDVPDDGNTIHVGDTAIVVSAAAGAVAIDLKADIRSAESDGVAGQTVGQAGGFLWVQNLDTGVRVACGGAPNPPGIFGTTAGDSIVTPSGTVTNLSIKNLPGGRARTDTTAASTSILPAACQFAAVSAGITYGVTYSVNFLDVPTSTSPGATE